MFHCCDFMQLVALVKFQVNQGYYQAHWPWPKLQTSSFCFVVVGLKLNIFILLCCCGPSVVIYKDNVSRCPKTPESAWQRETSHWWRFLGLSRSTAVFISKILIQSGPFLLLWSFQLQTSGLMFKKINANEFIQIAMY